MAWGDKPDLRFLVGLECFSFTGYMRTDREDRCYKDLRLPPFVNTVVYARRDYQWDDKNTLTYGEQAAFRYFVDNRDVVAPGLQLLILRISAVDERDRRLIGRIRQEFEGAEVKVAVEIVPGAKGFRLD